MHSITIVLCLLIQVSLVLCYSFNTEDVLVITRDSVKDTYFSYSLLLQSNGRNAYVIVGAPKNNENGRGTIYRCDVYPNGNTTCLQYNTGKIPAPVVNGNMLGINLDGDDQVDGEFVACAPRTIVLKSGKTNYFKGFCVYMRNSSHITHEPDKIIPFNNGIAYPDISSLIISGHNIGFYYYAFAMAGFDMYYSKTNKEILLGAPGVRVRSGVTASYSLSNGDVKIFPPSSFSWKWMDDTYFGYSVAAFEQNGETYYLAGAPRGNGLKGEAIIYQKSNIMEPIKMKGEEIGSYFGAEVLAVDVSNDGTVDILVSAPMGQGKTYDEGYVYFYKGLSDYKYDKEIKLTGSAKIGSRFGTVLSMLGDFDLDGFNDVVISAPYEDNGRGAIYIYKGSSNGLDQQNHERLSPSDFNINKLVKGFGLGMSKGNDIDFNGHNDIAIGAYKTDQVFIIKSKSFVDYNIDLRSNVNNLSSNTTELSLNVCMSYNRRSRRPILPQVVFNIFMDIDYRSVLRRKNDYIQLNLREEKCKPYGLKLRNVPTDITPFVVQLKASVTTKNIIGHGKKSLELQIPYLHGCGNDNICNTGLSIKLSSQRKRITLGLNKQIDLDVFVNNDGEPAYKCELAIQTPEGVELRNSKNCFKNVDNYTCSLNDKLTGNETKRLTFDLIKVHPSTKEIGITVTVTSLGVNKKYYLNNGTLTIPIVLDNTPYILSKTIPEDFELKSNDANVEDTQVIHQFSVGKNGPSPLLVDLQILVPIVKYKEEAIFKVLNVKATVNNVEISCAPTTQKKIKVLGLTNNLKVPLNRTIVLSCTNSEDCLQFSCHGEYVYSSAELAVVQVKTLVRSNLLAKKYANEFSTKNLIVFVPVAYQDTADDSVNATSVFLIFVSLITDIPLWAYLLAAILAVVLLVLIIWGLYHCHFFDRNYKDKLMQEKILQDQDSEIENEQYDEVVFQSMEGSSVQELRR